MAESSNINPDNVGRMVMLAYGLMSDSKPFWCYVAVKPSRYDELRRIIAGKKFDIRNYEKEGFGEIIVSGESVIPPQDVTKKVASMFKIPIRQLFADIDPKEEITKEIERLNNESGEE